MFPEIERVLVGRERIEARVREMGREIAEDLLRDAEATGVDDIVLVPVLTGAVVFVADLIRQMPLRMRLGVVAVSSYPGRTMESKGAAIRGELPRDLGGKHILIVDDILDSGRTLGLVRRLVLEQSPRTVRVCVLLRKVVERAEALEPDYVGFEIPDEFVVGYGLDYDGYYRNHPEIATLAAGAVRGEHA